jgi:hypothetical protein
MYILNIRNDFNVSGKSQICSSPERDAMREGRQRAQLFTPPPPFAKANTSSVYVEFGGRYDNQCYQIIHDPFLYFHPIPLYIKVKFESVSKNPKLNVHFLRGDNS